MDAGVPVPGAPAYSYGAEFGDEDDDDPALAVWMPTAPVSEGGRLNEVPQNMKPLPQHDGTECLKYVVVFWGCFCF